jgi:hypothetical protein
METEIISELSGTTVGDISFGQSRSFHHLTLLICRGYPSLFAQPIYLLMYRQSLKKEKIVEGHVKR